MAFSSEPTPQANANMAEKIIKSASAELARRNLPLAAYRPDIMRDGKHFIVIFTDKDLPPNARGVAPKVPTLEVEVDSGTLQVVRSYFAR